MSRPHRLLNRTPWRTNRRVHSGAAAAGVAMVLGLATACSSPPSSADAVRPVSVTAAPVVVDSPSSSTTDGISQLARRFVYRVRNDACLTTGTAFSSQGTLVTNRHVAAGASTLDLATWDGTDFKATVAVHSDTEDLALVDAVPPDDTYATVALSEPGPGTQVWVAGYPLGDQLTVTTGKVLRIISGTPFGMGGRVLEISNKVEPGNSGSPVLDASGQVVAVVFAIEVGNGDGLALPVSEVRALANGGGGDSSPIGCVE